MRLDTCAYPGLQEGSLYFSDALRGRAVCPPRLYLPFLTGRSVLLAAAGWHGKGTNSKKSLHPAPTHNLRV